MTVMTLSGKGLCQTPQEVNLWGEKQWSSGIDKKYCCH